MKLSAYSLRVPRHRLTDDDRSRGRALGELIRQARGARSAAEVARAADIPLDTLRRLEQGGTPTPGFFLMAQLVPELGTSLDDLASEVLRGNKEAT